MIWYSALEDMGKYHMKSWNILSCSFSQTVGRVYCMILLTLVVKRLSWFPKMDWTSSWQENSVYGKICPICNIYWLVITINFYTVNWVGNFRCTLEQIAKTPRYDYLFSEYSTQMGRAKSGLIRKVVRLSGWSLSKVPLHTYSYGDSGMKTCWHTM